MTKTRLLAAAVAGLLALPAAASADVTVTTTVDDDDGECVVDCTLREALEHTTAGEVVTVPAGTYDVTEQLFVGHDLTVRGAGARTTTIRYANATTDGRVMSIATPT